LRRDCCIIEIAENGECKLYEIGENIGRHSNVDSANAKADDLPPRSLLAIAVRQLKDACAFEAPIIDEGETWNEKGEPVPFRSILLPLCDDYGQAVKFLAGGRCKNIPSDV
jgi:hypothetical protein